MPTQPGLRVLVVENHRQSAEMLALSLRTAGHEVELVPDGWTALEAVRAALPDVVVLATALPDVDGYAVAKRIQGQSAGRKPFLIALTERDDPEADRRSQEAGIDLCLAKPVDLDKLHGLLRRFQGVVQDLEGFDPGI